MALRSVIAVAMAAAIIVGCNPGTTTTGSPAPATLAPSNPAATSTAEQTAAIESPEPTAGVVCPSDLPNTLASVEELADPTCYGNTELTIDGWLAETGLWVYPGETEPSWTMSIAALYRESPTAGDWLVDFMLADKVPGGVAVVAKPNADLDLSGNGRWVTLRGHFNDEAASACQQVRRRDEPRDCTRLFVVSSVESRPAASPVCPSEPMALEAFLAADVTCFRGRAVKIRGWEDVGEGFGGTGPIYRPTLPASLELAEAQLVASRWESDLGQTPVFPWIVAGSGVRFDASDRRVVVTGRLGHSIASECRAVPADGWTWAPPDLWAQHFCERMFVITDVRVVD